jgi:hypothetical protein
MSATHPDPRQRNGKRAVQQSELVRAVIGDADPRVLDVLAAAYAEDGRFGEAITTARQALSRAAAQPALETALRQRLRLYEDGKAFRALRP